MLLKAWCLLFKLSASPLLAHFPVDQCWLLTVPAWGFDPQPQGLEVEITFGPPKQNHQQIQEENGSFATFLPAD